MGARTRCRLEQKTQSASAQNKMQEFEMTLHSARQAGCEIKTRTFAPQKKRKEKKHNARGIHKHDHRALSQSNFMSHQQHKKRNRTTREQKYIGVTFDVLSQCAGMTRLVPPADSASESNGDARTPVWLACGRTGTLKMPYA